MFDAVKSKIRRWHMKMLKPFGVVPPTALKLSLGDHSPFVAESLAQVFADVAAAEVVHGNLLDLDCDALVSPANSFGDMSGGIDKAIDDFYRGEAQSRLVAAIAERFLGELPVGMAVVLELSSKRFPFLIAAPTMRIPGSIAGSINAYLAMRAVLVAVKQFNETASRPIRSLAVCGLGTGVGGLHAADAALQMRTAYDSIIGEQWRQVQHPVLAPYAMRRAR
ncbi:macro domain-containing protein [Limnoglobus roseus]|uniref:Appr-1-p processing protein n=1 Tax=Limnoglobus roseus TaxID=2598579 RepID=A0A5C1A874_9BACT|nr:macro domain-containing protein [Limnoglobus roseus]QEL13368.1 Appr-1-p processing protein [Limnoglobus roseus]